MPKQEQMKSKAKGNSLLEALAAIMPEQAEENERVMAKRRAEAVARGQHPMQPYADGKEAIRNSMPPAPDNNTEK